MSRAANIALRSAQAIVTVAELGLTAYVAHLALTPDEYCDFDSVFDQTDCYETSPPGLGELGAFLLFNCVWTILTLIVLLLVPLFMTIHPILVTVLDCIAMLVWFSGAVGMAVVSAGYGAIPDAQIALAFIIWALFVATFVLTLLDLIHGHKNRHIKETSVSGFNQHAGHSTTSTYYQQNPEMAPTNRPMSVRPVPQPAPAFHPQPGHGASSDHYQQNPELAA